MPSSLIAALLIERAGYVRRGLDDRVRQVDEALRGAGYVRPESHPVREVAVQRDRLQSRKRR